MADHEIDLMDSMRPYPEPARCELCGAAEEHECDPCPWRDPREDEKQAQWELETRQVCERAERPMKYLIPILIFFGACSSGGSKSSPTTPDPTPTPDPVVNYHGSVAVDNDNLSYGETANIAFSVVNLGTVERPAAIRLLGEISGLSVDAAPGETWTQAITFTNNRTEVDPAFVVPQTDTYVYEVVVDGEVTQTLSYSITTTPALISGST